MVAAPIRTPTKQKASLVVRVAGADTSDFIPPCPLCKRKDRTFEITGSVVPRKGTEVYATCKCGFGEHTTIK